MSGHVNKVLLIGNLGADPEVCLVSRWCVMILEVILRRGYLGQMMIM